MRRWGVTRDGDSLWWPAIGRNKRSVALDLRHERGTRRSSPSRRRVRRRARELPARPPRRVGARLRRPVGRATPRLVMVHISGFGQTGPLAGQAGFGSIGEAMGGIRHTTGSPDRPPSRAGISLGDALAVGVRRRSGRCRRWSSARATGVGQEVDVAIYEAVAALMESTMADYELAGVVARRAPAACCRAWRRRTCTRRATAPRSSSPPTPTPCSPGCARRWAGRSWPTDDRFATHGARGDEHGRARRRRRGVDVDAAVRRGARACSITTACPAGGSSPRRTCSPTRSTSPARWCSGSRRPRDGRCR